MTSVPLAMSLPIFKSPACIITSDTDGKLEVNQDVLRQVDELDGPLVVVAVAGLYRTGKSYLMNRLALSHGGVETSQGFPLGNTIESKTKGIWIWARQHPRRQDQYILLLDTEGLGDAHKGDPNHDIWIFCLATLLSSILCYNAKGAIDDDSLRKLNFISEFSKHIRAYSEEPKENDIDLFFPHFVYVIRDFHLKLERDGTALTADEYLEDALTLKPGDSRHEKDYNSPRLCIKKYFKQRHCFVFNFPVLDPDLMEHLDSVPQNQLSRKFLQQTEHFCDYIFRHAPVKNMENGQPINGRMWSSLLATYVESLRSGRVPCVQDAVHSMAITENSRLLEECVVMYMARMLHCVSMPTSDDVILGSHHFVVLEEVRAEFTKRAIFDDICDFNKKLNERLRILWEDMKRQNDQASTKLCKDVLAQLEEPYRQKMVDGKYTCSGGYALYKADMNYVKSEYSKLDYLGVKKEESLLEYLDLRWKEGEMILAMDKTVTQKERMSAITQAIAVEAERKRAEAVKAAAKAKQDAAQRALHDKETMVQLETKMTADLENIKTNHKEVLTSKLKEQERLMKEGFEKQSNALKNHIAQLQRRV